jgi:hypothetical protein
MLNDGATAFNKPAVDGHASATENMGFSKLPSQELLSPALAIFNMDMPQETGTM